jgi:hypothetical protein
MPLSMHLSHPNEDVLSSEETDFGSTDILCGSNSTGCLPSSQSSSLEVHVCARYLLQTVFTKVNCSIVVSNSIGCLSSSQSSSLEVHVSAKYLLQTEDGLIVIAIVVVMFVVEVVIVLMR